MAPAGGVVSASPPRTAAGAPRLVTGAPVGSVRPGKVKLGGKNAAEDSNKVPKGQKRPALAWKPKKRAASSTQLGLDVQAGNPATNPTTSMLQQTPEDIQLALGFSASVDDAISSQDPNTLLEDYESEDCGTEFEEQQTRAQTNGSSDVEYCSLDNGRKSTATTDGSLSAVASRETSFPPESRSVSALIVEDISEAEKMETAEFDAPGMSAALRCYAEEPEYPRSNATDASLQSHSSRLSEEVLAQLNQAQKSITSSTSRAQLLLDQRPEDGTVQDAQNLDYLNASCAQSGGLRLEDVLQFQGPLSPHREDDEVSFELSEDSGGSERGLLTEAEDNEIWRAIEAEGSSQVVDQQSGGVFFVPPHVEQSQESGKLSVSGATPGPMQQSLIVEERRGSNDEPFLLQPHADNPTADSQGHQNRQETSGSTPAGASPSLKKPKPKQKESGSSPACGRAASSVLVAGPAAVHPAKPVNHNVPRNLRGAGGALVGRVPKAAATLSSPAPVPLARAPSPQERPQPSRARFAVCPSSGAPGRVSAVQLIKQISGAATGCVSGSPRRGPSWNELPPAARAQIIEILQQQRIILTSRAQIKKAVDAIRRACAGKAPRVSASESTPASRQSSRASERSGAAVRRHTPGAGSLASLTPSCSASQPRQPLHQTAAGRGSLGARSRAVLGPSQGGRMQSGRSLRRSVSEQQTSTPSTEIGARSLGGARGRGTVGVPAAGRTRSGSRLLCPHGLRYKSLCAFCGSHDSTPNSIASRGFAQVTVASQMYEKAARKKSSSIVVNCASRGRPWSSVTAAPNNTSSVTTLASDSVNAARQSVGAASCVSTSTAMSRTSVGSKSLDSSLDLLPGGRSIGAPRGRSRCPRRASSGTKTSKTPQEVPPVFLRLWENALEKQRARTEDLPAGKSTNSGVPRHSVAASSAVSGAAASRRCLSDGPVMEAFGGASRGLGAGLGPAAEGAARCARTVAPAKGPSSSAPVAQHQPLAASVGEVNVSATANPQRQQARLANVSMQTPLYAAPDHQRPVQTLPAGTPAYHDGRPFIPQMHGQQPVVASKSLGTAFFPANQAPFFPQGARTPPPSCASLSTALAAPHGQLTGPLPIANHHATPSFAANGDMPHPSALYALPPYPNPGMAMPVPGPSSAATAYGASVSAPFRSVPPVAPNAFLQNPTPAFPMYPPRAPNGASPMSAFTLPQTSQMFAGATSQSAFYPAPQAFPTATERGQGGGERPTAAQGDGKAEASAAGTESGMEQDPAAGLSAFCISNLHIASRPIPRAVAAKRHPSVASSKKGEASGVSPVRSDRSKTVKTPKGCAWQLDKQAVAAVGVAKPNKEAPGKAAEQVTPAQSNGMDLTASGSYMDLQTQSQTNQTEELTRQQAWQAAWQRQLAQWQQPSSAVAESQEDGAAAREPSPFALPQSAGNPPMSTNIPRSPIGQQRAQEGLPAGNADGTLATTSAGIPHILSFSSCAPLRASPSPQRAGSPSFAFPNPAGGSSPPWSSPLSPAPTALSPFATNPGVAPASPPSPIQSPQTKWTPAQASPPAESQESASGGWPEAAEAIAISIAEENGGYRLNDEAEKGVDETTHFGLFRRSARPSVAPPQHSRSPAPVRPPQKNGAYVAPQSVPAAKAGLLFCSSSAGDAQKGQSGPVVPSGVSHSKSGLVMFAMGGRRGENQVSGMVSMQHRPRVNVRGPSGLAEVHAIQGLQRQFAPPAFSRTRPLKSQGHAAGIPGGERMASSNLSRVASAADGRGVSLHN
ncbi:hypothetical protein BESB_004190 [Besnoitia besnoiti]|uniref:Uncharacterized protein n=1 Tax=Besnoitia besnoiti TaxID=94643 RepID=A0A2A9MHQ7_BESBE|nr:hypothetical protein BESB_004190 [Besnoitia besnoiti]PFH38078.1 hypothetical protein BESB_004190 [Besnoitia besnoiti]